MNPIIEINYVQCQRTNQTRERCKIGLGKINKV